MYILGNTARIYALCRYISSLAQVFLPTKGPLPKTHLQKIKEIVINRRHLENFQFRVPDKDTAQQLNNWISYMDDDEFIIYLGKFLNICLQF